MSTMHIVPEARSLKPGEKVIVKVAGTEIGIYNVGGQLHAVRNVCADQGGPLCQGEVFDRIEADFNQDHT
jgi:3-phenylpropionate/trans-cinnamate dioxygenase ferredoxin subunit